VIDVKRIPEMCPTIRERDGIVTIGATTVMTDLAANETVRRHFGALAEAAAVVGSVQIRNRATVAGNICNASPAADTAPPLLVYGAVVVAAGPGAPPDPDGRFLRPVRRDHPRAKRAGRRDRDPGTGRPDPRGACPPDPATRPRTTDRGPSSATGAPARPIRQHRKSDRCEIGQSKSKMLSSLRHTFRSLAKSPGFAATALATLAICLGANLTIFAVVDAILVRSLPFPHPERLVAVFNSYPGAGVERASASIPNYYDRRSTIKAFASLSIYQDGSIIVGGAGSPTRVPMARVSPEFFSTLGMPLARGRVFTDDQLKYGTDEVAVLTDGFWRSHFSADPNVLGRTFLNDGITITIIGVLPQGFRFLSSAAEFYRPSAHAPEDRQPQSRHNKQLEHDRPACPRSDPRRRPGADRRLQCSPDGGRSLGPGHQGLRLPHHRQFPA